MSCHNRWIALPFSILFIFFLVNLASAQMSCVDFKPGTPNYGDKMDELAKRARLPDNYWNRYHESLVNYLCRGDIRAADKLVDNGFVKPQQAQSIATVLGKQYKPRQRSEAGQTYGYSKEKFLEMGACNACADNIAQYYAKRPDSPCAKLAKKALEGNPQAIRELVAFPDYCRWKY